MADSIALDGIRNITVSGRIASGASTLAARLAKILGWKFLDGGKLFRKYYHEQGFELATATGKSPDEVDLDFEKRVRKMLEEQSHQIVQSHLAGFTAQGVAGVFKILVLCEDFHGHDKMDVRIDRLVNRDRRKVEEAKREVIERERVNLTKWRRLYASDDPGWVYWDKKYYDLVVNTFTHNPEESIDLVLEKLRYRGD
jgi:cytidylate kinase